MAVERKLKARYESRLARINGKGEPHLLFHDTEEEQDVWFEIADVPDDWFEAAPNAT